MAKSVKELNIGKNTKLNLLLLSSLFCVQINGRLQSQKKREKKGYK